jgi:hypothetical protein
MSDYRRLTTYHWDFVNRGRHSLGWNRVARELDMTLRSEAPTGRRRAA